MMMHGLANIKKKIKIIVSDHNLCTIAADYGDGVVIYLSNKLRA